MQVPPGAYKSSLVSKKTSTKDLSLRDTYRAKEIGIRVTYPSTSGQFKFPVVIISPMVLGPKDTYTKLATTFSQCGYIVITIVHSDNIKAQRKKQGFAFLVTEGIRSVAPKLSTNPTLWIDRVCDVIFILEQLTIIEKTVVDLRNHMDSDHIAIFGHDFGALIAMIVAGVWIEIPDTYLQHIEEPSYKPVQKTNPKGVTLCRWNFPKVTCALIISPIEPGSHGIHEDSFEYTMPCFFVSSHTDLPIAVDPRAGFNCDLKKIPYDFGNHSKDLLGYFLQFASADHGFGDLAGMTIVNTLVGWKASGEDIYVIICSLAFLDGFLKSRSESIQWLDTSANRFLEQKGILISSGLEASQPFVQQPNPQSLPVPTPKVIQSGGNSTSHSSQLANSWQSPSNHSTPVPAPAPAPAANSYASMLYGASPVNPAPAPVTNYNHYASVMQSNQASFYAAPAEAASPSAYSSSLYSSFQPTQTSGSYPESSMYGNSHAAPMASSYQSSLYSNPTPALAPEPVLAPLQYATSQTSLYTVSDNDCQTASMPQSAPEPAQTKPGPRYTITANAEAPPAAPTSQLYY
jgi:hypothetical protein